VTESPLFIRLYLDEDVSVFAAQLQFAEAHQRTILTHNRCDYERLHEAALREQHFHSGILIANRRASDFELARRIMTVLNTFTAEEMTNQLLYL
jgi:Tat protein secretion system quality control protein TatD with DNase activity